MSYPELQENERLQPLIANTWDEMEDTSTVKKPGRKTAFLPLMPSCRLQYSIILWEDALIHLQGHCPQILRILEAK